jgi:citrate lyase beta subunit
MCIHPKQLEIVNTAFTPTPDEVAYARRVAQAHEANQNSGKGAFARDGKMIDMPIVKQAWRELAMAGHPAVI